MTLADKRYFYVGFFLIVARAALKLTMLLSDNGEMLKHCNGTSSREESLRRQTHSQISVPHYIDQVIIDKFKF